MIVDAVTNAVPCESTGSTRVYMKYWRLANNVIRRDAIYDEEKWVRCSKLDELICWTYLPVCRYNMS